VTGRTRLQKAPGAIVAFGWVIALEENLIFNKFLSGAISLSERSTTNAGVIPKFLIFT
jgi:hypothetical protein